ncbi:MAG: DEAD/DEAH box helicase [Clostridia bacterium]|nr:DEAD/DEAH box helicase [Clostridia bacterium]
MKFTELDFNPKILKALESFNFENTTQVQEQTIPIVLEKKDVIVRSETGSGKTLAYALPIIQNVDKYAENVEALIICPTRELCLQVTDEIKKILGFLENIKVAPVYGGSSIDRQIIALKRKPQIIVGTPGRIMDHMSRRTLKLESIKTLVLDEADEMLNMGFKEDIEKILKSTPKTRQTLLFSATYPESIKQITKNYQNNPVKIEIGVENRSLANLSQYYVVVNKNSKKEALLEILNTKKPKLSIVFSNTKRMADTIATYLNDNSHNATPLHGDLKQSQRKKVIDSVKLGKVEILVASDVAARGLDINDVEYVINFDVPVNVEYFIHRIGRTARIGKNGNSMTIITSNLQLKTLREYEKQTESNIQEINLSITEKSTAESQNEKSEKRPQKRFSNFGKKTFGTKRQNNNFKNPAQKEKRSFEKTDYKTFERKEKNYSKTEKPFRQEKSFNKDDKPFRQENKFFKKKENNFSNTEKIKDKKTKKDFSKPFEKSTNKVNTNFTKKIKDN